MVATGNKKLWYALLLAVVALTGLRIFMAGRTELLPEEAYYWTYAKHPALGYFDHPPMVAWTVALGTWLCGDTPLGVRLINMLLWICSLFGLLQIGKLWFEERVAIGAALLFTLLPVFMLMGFMVTPDGPLIFFWVLTLYALSRALQSQGGWGFWLLAGVAFGGSMLSKYYAVLLGPSLLWFLLLSSKYRFWLKRPQPWVAVILALLVFSPVILWNSQHQWASFAFQSTRTVAQKGHVLRWLGIFWLEQLGVLTPLGLVLFGAAAWQAIKRGWLQRLDHWNFAASFGLPLFGLFVAASFKTSVHINWTAPAFIALSLAASALWVEALDSSSEQRRKWWRYGAWTMGILGIVITLGAHYILATGQPERIAYIYANGWHELAERVDALAREEQARTGQRPFLIGTDKYYTAAELGYYLGPPSESVNSYAFGDAGLGYRYWTDLQKFKGRPALIITWGARPATVESWRRHFDRFEEAQPLAMETPGKRWREVKVIKAYGYHPEISGPLPEPEP